MSMQRIHGEVSFECNSCGETFEMGSENFDITWNAAKRDGWTAKKIGNDWIHTCNECNEEENG